MPRKGAPKKPPPSVEDPPRKRMGRQRVLQPASPSVVEDSDVAVSPGNDSAEDVESDGLGDFINDSDPETLSEDDPLLLIHTPKDTKGLHGSGRKVEVVMTSRSPTKSTRLSADDARIQGVSVKGKSRKRTESYSDEVIELTESEESDAMSLHKGDSMYPGPIPSNKISTKKRALDATPPLHTRSSAPQTLLGSPMLESPTKKVRITGKTKSPKTKVDVKPLKFKNLFSSEDDDDHLENNNIFKGRPAAPAINSRQIGQTVKVPAKQTSKSSKSKPIHASDDSDDNSDPADLHTPKQKPIAKREELSASEAENKEQSSASGKPTVYQQDLTMLTVKALPLKCEVDNVDLHDPILAGKKLYKGLPKLLFCELVTAGSNTFAGRSNGGFKFSAWPSLCRDFKMKTGMNVIAFTLDRQYINPARVSPLLVQGRLINGFNRYELAVQGQTAICVSLILLTDSFIYSTPPGLKHYFHAIRGYYHAQEQERFAGVLGMVTGQKAIASQIWGDVVTFQTKTQEVASSSNSLPPTFFSSSPKKGKAPGPNTIVTALEYDNPIPVYDATAAKDNYKWSADIFSELDGYFPRWEDTEIPKHSSVIVGYVVNFTSASGNNLWKSYNNVQWAVVLGCPP